MRSSISIISTTNKLNEVVVVVVIAVQLEAVSGCGIVSFIKAEQKGDAPKWTNFELGQMRVVAELRIKAVRGLRELFFVSRLISTKEDRLVSKFSNR